MLTSKCFCDKNQLILSGVISLVPVKKVSPSGIQHHQFILEHSSQQKEAGLIRQAWCRMPVVFSGQIQPMLIKKLTFGNRISVQGFISSHQGRNGLKKLVLHAEKIELIDFGE